MDPLYEMSYQTWLHPGKLTFWTQSHGSLVQMMFSFSICRVIFRFQPSVFLGVICWEGEHRRSLDDLDKNQRSINISDVSGISCVEMEQVALGNVPHLTKTFRRKSITTRRNQRHQTHAWTSFKVQESFAAVPGFCLSVLFWLNSLLKTNKKTLEQMCSSTSSTSRHFRL